MKTRVGSLEGQVSVQDWVSRELRDQGVALLEGLEALEESVHTLQETVHQWHKWTYKGEETTRPPALTREQEASATHHPHGEIKKEPGDDLFSHMPCRATPSGREGGGQDAQTLTGLGNLFGGPAYPSPKLPTSVASLFSNAAGIDFQLPNIDMRGTTHDGSKHVNFVDVKIFG